MGISASNLNWWNLSRRISGNAINVVELYGGCGGFNCFVFSDFFFTPPKFNIAPEIWWLEDEFPFGIAYFQGLC